MARAPRLFAAQVGREGDLDQVGPVLGERVELSGREGACDDRHGGADRGLLGEATRRLGAGVAVRAFAQQLDQPPLHRNALTGQGGLGGGLVRGEDQVRLAGKAVGEGEGGADTAGEPVGPVRLGGAGPGDRLPQCLDGAALGGEDAVELVVEELVEGGASRSLASTLDLGLRRDQSEEAFRCVALRLLDHADDLFGAG